MAERSADKGTVCGHLRNSGCKVVSILVSVLGNPRGEELLKCRKRSRCEHLRSQWVCLELLEVGLQHLMLADSSYCCASTPGNTYSKIPLGALISLPAGESYTSSMGNRVLGCLCWEVRRSRTSGLLDCLFLELDGHDGQSGMGSSLRSIVAQNVSEALTL